MRTKRLMLLICTALIVILLSSCGQSTYQSGTPSTSAASSPVSTQAGATGTLTPSQNPVKTTFPLTIKDDVGRSVTIEKAPTKIISLAPSNTEILFALGLGDQVVGVSDFCDYPAEAKKKPSMGGTQPSLEKIVAAAPDLVLTVSETAGAPDIATKLEGLNIKVIVLGPKNIEGILSSIRTIGLATGKNSEAASLNKELKTTISGIVDKTSKASKPRVMYELDATDAAKPYLPGPGSFIDSLIGMAGGTNIAADAKLEWAQMSLEEIVNKNPEIIILGDANYGVTAAQVKTRAGWTAIKACQDNKVFSIDDNLISRPGPRIAEGLTAMAKIVHPELFP